MDRVRECRWTPRCLEVGGKVPVVTIKRNDGPPGTPVLLLHGWPQSSLMWEAIDEELLAKRRFVAIDLPGFGGTDPLPRRFRFEEAAAVVERVLDTLGIERCEVIAHDVGAWIAFALDERYVERLLAMGVPPPWVARRDLLRALPRFGYQLGLVIPVVSGALVKSGWIVGRYLQRGAFRARAWDGAGHVAYTTYSGQFAGAGRAVATVRIYRTMLFREILLRIVSAKRRQARQKWEGTDVGLLIGSDDPVFGASFFRYTEVVGFEVVPDCGHYTIDEQPALTNAAIRRFLQRPVARPAKEPGPEEPWGSRLRTAVGRDRVVFRDRLATVHLPRQKRRFRLSGERPSTVPITRSGPAGARRPRRRVALDARTSDEEAVRAGGRAMNANTVEKEWLAGTRFTAGDGSDPSAPARIVLRQVDDGCFMPVEPFTYTRRDGRTITVDSTTLPDTDLTSVPIYLSWFVSRHGRHTPAVLVHDRLVPPDLRRDRAGYELLVDANNVFLEAMDDLGVPPVRKRLLWATVVLLTRTALRPWGIVGVGAWILVGVILVAAAIVTRDPLVIAVALVGPLPASILLGRDTWPAGVVVGYAAPILLLPAAASFGGYACYRTMEEIVTRFLAWRKGPQPSPVPLKEA